MKKTISVILILLVIPIFSGCMARAIVDIKNLKDDVNTLNQRLDSLQIKVINLNSQLDSLKEQIPAVRVAP